MKLDFLLQVLEILRQLIKLQLQSAEKMVDPEPWTPPAQTLASGPAVSLPEMNHAQNRRVSPRQSVQSRPLLLQTEVECRRIPTSYHPASLQSRRSSGDSMSPAPQTEEFPGKRPPVETQACGRVSTRQASVGNWCASFTTSRSALRIVSHCCKAYFANIA